MCIAYKNIVMKIKAVKLLFVPKFYSWEYIFYILYKYIVINYDFCIPLYIYILTLYNNI